MKYLTLGFLISLLASNFVSANDEDSSNAVLTLSMVAGSGVQVGVPADSPNQLLHNLSNFLQDKTDVESAKLSLIRVFPEGQEPFFSYVVGINSTSKQTLIDSISVAKSSPAGRWPAIITLVSEADYLFTDEAIVFYER
ncbi:enhanced serine sensitivity protein SseB C-terminal domain-containing protein [Vibrio genomosp. F10]|uniref:enhanced serine sensitivity protein SseB C-terminal domain-containing protein n=1 Tax=Vibrio genomosp. F10 TaxID=723171 RepID=UPI0002E3FFFC|nr:enhanced serine sensitivity protein SseB C-terminal domain-containing protein [Vibrio genomosp. F10]OEF05942.1 hypothetical protein A1QI_07175 [Vibrio genomosp. F10 str. 9ZB36]